MNNLLPQDDVVILSVEDDEGHAILVRENLEASGITNRIEHFADGQAVLDFFSAAGGGRQAKPGRNYVILLDIRMPKIDGIEVLRRLKADPHLRTLPVIMLTTADDVREVDHCYQIGCSAYVRKPVEFAEFSETIQRLGRFISLLKIPALPRASRDACLA